MGRHADEFVIAGTSALKADVRKRNGEAKIIEFPASCVREGEPSAKASRMGAVRGLGARALRGIDRDAMRGTSFGRMTRTQSAMLGCAGFALALIAVLIGA